MMVNAIQNQQISKRRGRRSISSQMRLIGDKNRRCLATLFSAIQARSIPKARFRSVGA